jgi:hypothetical protein
VQREEFQVSKAVWYSLPSATLLTLPFTISLQEEILAYFSISFQLPDRVLFVSVPFLAAVSVVGHLKAVRYCDRTLSLDDWRRIPLRIFNLLALIVILAGLAAFVAAIPTWGS